MFYYSEPVARLVEEFSKLPGIGPKTAQRLAFYLLGAPKEVAQSFARAILDAREIIKRCSVCFNLTDADPCGICNDERRLREFLCVVEEPRDVAALEKARGFKGCYHVLHGAISPIDGMGPEDLTIKQLLARLGNGVVTEVVIATNPSVEGDATALYLAKIIKPLGIKTTRLAHGLPVGASLEYADGMTLSRALEGRREI